MHVNVPVPFQLTRCRSSPAFFNAAAFMRLILKPAPCQPAILTLWFSGSTTLRVGVKGGGGFRGMADLVLSTAPGEGCKVDELR